MVSVKKIVFLSIFLFIGACFFSAGSAKAQSDSVTDMATSSPPVADTYLRAVVTKITASGTVNTDGENHPYQTIEVRIEEGPDKDKMVTIDNGQLFTITPAQLVTIGQELVVAKPASAAKDNFYYIVDTYRANKLIWLFIAFAAVTLLIGGWRGFTSLVGLFFTILVLFYYVVPHILKGGNPLTIALIASLIITFCSIYISHGFNKRTTVALVSTFITLGITIFLSIASVNFANLTGSGSEDSFYLQMSDHTLDLRGLLLAGIIISVLGILDDITTGTTAAVEEIHNADPTLNARELYKRGLSVGREHIASLVNTLLLAYTGSSLPLIILFTMQKQLPFFMTINSSFLAEEIVRTVVGSMALIVAVPITTALASIVWGNIEKSAPAA